MVYMRGCGVHVYVCGCACVHVCMCACVHMPVRVSVVPKNVDCGM